MLLGNQPNNLAEYQIELVKLMEGCTSYEKRIIYEIALAAKKSLSDNKCLQSQDDKL